MRITSDANPYYKQLQRLAAGPRACREAGRTLAEGIHLVECAAGAGTDVLTIVLSEAAAAEAKSLGAAVAANASCRTIELPPRLYNALSPVEHGSGILAEIAITRHALPRALQADAIYLDGVRRRGPARGRIDRYYVPLVAEGAACRDGSALRAGVVRRRTGGSTGGSLCRGAPRGGCAGSGVPLLVVLGYDSDTLALRRRRRRPSGDNGKSSATPVADPDRFQGRVAQRRGGCRSLSLRAAATPR